MSAILKTQFLTMVRRGIPAQRITDELGNREIRQARLHTELAGAQRRTFAFNLLGSIHTADARLVLDDFPRPEALALIRD